MQKSPEHRVGSHWRVQSRSGEQRLEVANQGWFDELVVDHWLHIEWMSGRAWWARIGDAQLNIRLLEDGSVDLKIERGVFENQPDARLARRSPAVDESQEEEPVGSDDDGTTL